MYRENAQMIEYGCKSCDRVFGRKFDAERHSKIHTKPSFNCDYEKCKETHAEKTEYRRDDNLREHYRDYHKEDLPPRYKSLPNDFWQTRRFDKSWWRCSKCLVRTNTENGWECSGCGKSCAVARKQFRSWQPENPDHVLVLAGPDGVPFGIEKDILCASSQLFADEIKEGGPVIRLPDIEEQSFTIVHGFLRSGKLSLDTHESLSYDVLLGIWKLGETLGSTEICDGALNKMVETRQASSTIPGEPHLLMVFNTEEHGSPMRELLLSWAADYAFATESLEFIENFPKGVQRELKTLVYSRHASKSAEKTTTVATDQAQNHDNSHEEADDVKNMGHSDDSPAKPAPSSQVTSLDMLSEIIPTREDEPVAAQRDTESVASIVGSGTDNTANLEHSKQLIDSQPDHQRPDAHPSAHCAAPADQNKSPLASTAGTMLEDTGNVDLSLDENQYIKPPFSYRELIIQAIEGSPGKRLKTTGIYKFCEKNYAYFRHRKTWQSGLRKRLYLGEPFEKSTDDRDTQWQIAPAIRSDLELCGYKELSLDENQNSQPPYSYQELIIDAMMGSPHGKLSLKGISSVIEKKFPYYRNSASDGLQASVRECLSRRRAFEMVDGRAGVTWQICEDVITSKPGPSRKRQADSAEDTITVKLPERPPKRPRTSSRKLPGG